MLKGKLSSEILNERQQYVNSLKRFVHEKKEKLQQVLDQLKLSDLTKIEAKQSCPFDSNHSVPENAFKKHVEKCRLLHAGFQEDELPSQLQNLNVCYEGTQVMKVDIDESLLNKIIWDECAQSGQVYTGHRTMPVSHIDEVVNLTQDDRLAVYNHVVKVSNEAGRVIPVDRTDHLLTTDWGQLIKKGMLSEENNKQYSSKLEQLAALRDLKRRRQSYRAKNVHITKKSYTEIIREVIVNQMQILVPEKESSKSEIPERDARDKDPSTSSTNSRDRKRKYQDKEEEKYEYSRKRGRSRERSRDRRSSKKERRSRDRYDIGRKDKYMDDQKTSKQTIDDLAKLDARLDEKKIEDIKSESESYDPSYYKEPCSSEYEKREKERISERRRDSESSGSSNDDDNSSHHHKSKRKKSKHKKKHSKKHKKRD